MTVRTAAKSRTIFRCTECGADALRWAGRCDGCGAWNTLVEEVTTSAVLRSPHVAAANALPAAVARLGDVRAEENRRQQSGLAEFDFVLGGGIVPGSLVLVGGEPGIGKSTLLLQVAARIDAAGCPTLYVSGEESAHQIRLRADRLSERADAVELLTDTSMERVVATVEARRAAGRAIGLLVVDSIQTMQLDALEGAPGSVGQVRECAAFLMRFAKATGIAVLLIGHVTKGGNIAGPKTLEHIVDTVLYFEGENSLDYRVLRATKNRFGSVDEIGVFRMVSDGLEPVENPSAVFVGTAVDRRAAMSGSALTALMEGSRPVIVEVQALAARAGYGTAQRVASGIDGRRLALLLAVLEKRGGISAAQSDVFCNVVGGFRVQEPSADLAVVTAIASSVRDRALPSDAVFIGEVGLSGELRPVSHAERRLSEASRLGIATAYLSARSIPARVPAGVRAVGVESLADVLHATLA